MFLNLLKQVSLYKTTQYINNRNIRKQTPICSSKGYINTHMNYLKDQLQHNVGEKNCGYMKPIKRTWLDQWLLL